MREMFCDLPAEERRRWTITADDASRAALKAWEEEVNGPVSTAPEDRQKYVSISFYLHILIPAYRCILGLVRFVQPILDLICEATGWKASFTAGGPEPAHDGKLNIIRYHLCSCVDVSRVTDQLFSIHSGKTSGDVPMDFGALEREAIRKTFIPMYGRFLKRCYCKWFTNPFQLYNSSNAAVEECRSRALKPKDSLSLETAGLELEGANLLGVNTPYGAADKKAEGVEQPPQKLMPQML